MVVTLVAFSSLGVWTFSSPQRDKAIARHLAAQAQVAQAIADKNRPIERASDATPTYFGVPVSGAIVAYVVDTDPAMAPYFGELASITNAVNQRGAQRFGVFYPGMPRKSSLLEVAENKRVLEDGEAVLASRIPAHGGGLGEALARAGQSFADELFLVLAKAPTPSEIDALTQSVEQTGAVTHVIAVGPAAGVDLSPIARATGGQFVRVDGRTFTPLP